MKVKAPADFKRKTECVALRKPHAMMYSMTGFGRIVREEGGLAVSVEIKSLNSKYLDLNIKLPNEFKEKEISLRKTLGQQFKRGKIDLAVNVELEDNSEKGILNRELIQSYYTEITSMREELGIRDQQGNELPLLLSLPNAIMAPEIEEDDRYWTVIEKAIEDVCEKLSQFREQEGEQLASDIDASLQAIKREIGSIRELEPRRLEQTRERLYKSIEQLSDVSVDENRFEQELIYYLEKLDINEELVRLQSHCRYFEETSASGSMEKGKKLSFISQEIGREINTIGSKANFAEIQHVVVKMKEELEKIKEQLLNVV